MRWFERPTDEARVHLLRQRQEQIERWWKQIMESACQCSQALMILEAAEQVLEQDTLSKDDPVWKARRTEVQESLAKTLKTWQESLKADPFPHLMWMRQCTLKAQEVCLERQCRPNPEVEYVEFGGGHVPVCGALEYLMKAAQMPEAEEIYESQAQGWDPSNFKSGGRNGTTDNW
jgi:hypothetical protein